jgi:type III secretion protein L
MLLVKKNELEIVSSGRLVKAEDVAAVRSAGDIIAAAEAEAAKLRETASAAYEAERRRGFEEGLQAGLRKVVEDKLDFAYESASYMESVEGKLADIVIKALKKCVSQTGDRTLVVEIVRKAMKAVIRNQRQITLKVAPDMVEAVKSRLDEILSDYPALERVDVVEDARLKGPAAIIETEAGVADASVDTQLAAIEKSIRKHFSKDNR